MPFYRSLGKVPHKRHTQFRRADGSLYHDKITAPLAFHLIFLLPLAIVIGSARLSRARRRGTAVHLLDMVLVPLCADHRIRESGSKDHKWACRLDVAPPAILSQMEVPSVGSASQAA